MNIKNHITALCFSILWLSSLSALAKQYKNHLVFSKEFKKYPTAISDMNKSFCAYQKIIWLRNHDIYVVLQYLPDEVEAQTAWDTIAINKKALPRDYNNIFLHELWHTRDNIANNSQYIWISNENFWRLSNANLVWYNGFNIVDSSAYGLRTLIGLEEWCAEYFAKKVDSSYIPSTDPKYIVWTVFVEELINLGYIQEHTLLDAHMCSDMESVINEYFGFPSAGSFFLDAFAYIVNDIRIKFQSWKKDEYIKSQIRKIIVWWKEKINKDYENWLIPYITR